MSKTVRVGIVRGGTEARGYQKSLSDGAILLRALREHSEYEPHDILIDKDEIWHMDGVPVRPERLAFHLDFCISTVEHPLENQGFVESILRNFGISCIHAPKEALRGYIPDSLARKIESVGVRTARRMKIGDSGNFFRDVHATFSPPYSVVFVDQKGRVQNLYHAKHMHDLAHFLDNHQSQSSGEYFLEEYVSGDEWAVTVMPRFRETLWYTLHPVYVGTVNPAFRSTPPASRSREEGFAAPSVREALDLYAKLAAAALELDIPMTFVFRHQEGRKPALLRAMERHMIEDDHSLLHALKESAIPESEFTHMMIEKQWA